jgi:hypothetical protein
MPPGRWGILMRDDVSEVKSVHETRKIHATVATRIDNVRPDTTDNLSVNGGPEKEMNSC